MDSKPTISAAGSQPQKTTGSGQKKPTVRVIRRAPTKAEQAAARLANPGERSKLPDSALTPDLLQQRQRNQYAAAPAAPGSSISNSQMDVLLNSLTGQKYGQVESALKDQSRNIPIWFQQYRDQVGQAKTAEAQAAQAQVGSLNQMAATAAGDMGAPQGAPLDPAAAQRAQAAAQIRSAGIGNQAALAQNLGGIQGNYLTNLGVLSQGQQQAAMIALAKQQTQLAADKGDFRTTQHDKILSDEADAALKNALTTAQIGSTNASAAATKASTTKTQVDTTKSQSDQAYFDKHGYYPGTGKPTTKTPDTITSGAFAGYTKTQVANMDPTSKQKKIDAYNKTKGAKGAAGAIDFGTPAQQGAAQSDLSRAMDYAKRLRGSKNRGEAAQYLMASSKPQPIYKTVKTSSGGTKQVKVLNADGTPKMTGSWSPVSSAVASAALDAVYDNHLSPATVRKLHEAGIKVKALGVPTRPRGASVKPSGAGLYPSKGGSGAGS